MMRALSSLSIVLYFVVSVQSQPSQFVVDGNLTTIASAPYLVGIFAFETYHRGSGAIISETSVLTSYNRLEGYAVSSLDIRGGATVIQLAKDRFKPAFIVKHPKYSKEPIPDSDDVMVYYNVALLKLKDGERFTGNLMKPVKLPDFGESISIGTVGKFAGWLADWPTGSTEDLLRIDDLSVVDRTECEAYWKPRYPFITGVPDYILCAKGYMICFFDIGGALVVNDKVYGISSWFNPYMCAKRMMPNGFIKVSDPEIRQFVRDWTGL